MDNVCHAIFPHETHLLIDSHIPHGYLGQRVVFGVIDMFSDFSDVTRIGSKTDVPDCIAQSIAYAASVGVNMLRMHTDNEAIFHTTQPQARDATKARFRDNLEACFVS